MKVRIMSRMKGCLTGGCMVEMGVLRDSALSMDMDTGLDMDMEESHMDRIQPLLELNLDILG
jgi:hypothetical protein